MKKIVILMLLLATVQLKAQSRIGSTLEEIKDEFSGIITEGTIQDSSYAIYSTFNSSSKIIYLINADSICIVSIIIPNNNAILNNYVEMFNKKYVTKSSTKWKAYLDGGICDVELIYGKNKDGEDIKPYFFWTESSDEKDN